MRLFKRCADAKREGNRVFADLANNRAVQLSPGRAADAQDAVEELQRPYQATGKRVSIRFAVGEDCEAVRKLNGRTLAEAVDSCLSNVASSPAKIRSHYKGLAAMPAAGPLATGR